jgi:hypothetical protein
MNVKVFINDEYICSSKGVNIYPFKQGRSLWMYYYRRGNRLYFKNDSGILKLTVHESDIKKYVRGKNYSFLSIK